MSLHSQHQGAMAPRGVSSCWSSICDGNTSSLCLLVEQIHSWDGGFFRLFDLRFGQLNATHGNRTTGSEVSADAANAEPKGPVQGVVQDDQDEQVLSVVCHPLCQAVVSHGCQETQNTQGAKQCWKQRADIRKAKCSGRGKTLRSLWMTAVST